MHYCAARIVADKSQLGMTHMELTHTQWTGASHPAESLTQHIISQLSMISFHKRNNLNQESRMYPKM